MLDNLDKETVDQAPRQKSSIWPKVLACCGCGCVLVIFLPIVFSLGTVYYLKAKYIADAPSVVIEQVNEEEAKAADARIKAAFERVGKGQATTAEMTMEDLNILLARESIPVNSKEVKGQAAVQIREIENDHIKFAMSIRIAGENQSSRADSQYLNLDGSIQLQVKDGDVFLKMKEIKVNNEKLPSFIEEMIKNPQKNNQTGQEGVKITHFFYKNKSPEEAANIQAGLKKLESIQARNGRLIFIFRPEKP